MQGSLMEGLSRLPKQLLGARYSHTAMCACCSVWHRSAGALMGTMCLCLTINILNQLWSGMH